MIHILSSNGCQHIDGRKEQTQGHDIISFDPDEVFIPTTDNKGMVFDNLIADGTSVKVGTLLGVRKDFGIPVYSPVSGVVKGKVKKTNTLIGRPADFLEIVNDKKDTRVTLAPISEKPTQADIVAKLKEGGIVGLGGAGFPAFIKYNIKPEMAIDHILINACECEPYLTTDEMAGRTLDLTDFYKAIQVLLDVLNIPTCLIVTKDEKVDLIKTLEEKTSAFGDKRISVYKMKSVYPAGYERTIIRMVLHREYDKLPSQAHAIVSNFQTMIAIGNLFFKGETVARKIITVSGLVASPANISTPYGTLIKDLIKVVGGYTAERVTLVNGGPMTCEHLNSDDIPLLLPNDAVTALQEKHYRLEPCLRCGNCTAYCPVNLQPVEINAAAARGDFERCFDLGALDCVSCGLCSYVCPSHIDVSAGVKQAKLFVNLKVARARKK